jgi:flagellar biosynthesis/type III secretory pathway M-ring protein FliF/YscJ
VEAPALTVKVASLLPKGEEQAPISDIKAPVAVDVAPAFWIALGVGVLVVAALAYALWRRLRRKPAEAARAPLPDLAPDQEARQALDSLARADHFGRGDGRGYYIALSVIAKRYLERRLQAPVLEMTTAEMLAFLREASEREPLAGVMRDVALAADQVKFAKGEALRVEGDRHLDAVRRLVEDLELRLRPVPAPGAGEGKAA